MATTAARAGDRIEYIKYEPPGMEEAARLEVSLPKPAAEAVLRVLEETGDRPGPMVAKALGLYMLALEARKRGKVVGAADSADVLDTEFTGF